MRPTTVFALRLALRAQIAIWRSLRVIKGRFSTRIPRLAINLSTGIDKHLRIAVLCHSGIDTPIDRAAGRLPLQSR